MIYYFTRFDSFFGRKKGSEPAGTGKRGLEEALKADPRAEMQRGSIQAEMLFTFFNRLQTVKIGGDSLTEIADKAAGYVAKLETGPSDSVVSGFKILIPGHPEIKDFPTLMQHATKVE